MATSKIVLLLVLMVVVAEPRSYAMANEQTDGKWWQQVWPGARHLLAPFEEEERSEIAEKVLLGAALYRDLPEVRDQIQGYAWWQCAILLMFARQVIAQRGLETGLGVIEVACESLCDPVNNIKIASEVLRSSDGYGSTESTERVRAALGSYLLPDIFDVAWLIDHPKQSWPHISRLLERQQRYRSLLAQGIERWRQAGFSDDGQDGDSAIQAIFVSDDEIDVLLSSVSSSGGDDGDEDEPPAKRRRR